MERTDWIAGASRWSSYPGRSSAGAIFRRALLLWAIWLTFGWLLLSKWDPFGAREAADLIHSRVVERFAAPFHVSKGYRHIVVVLLTPFSRRELGWDYWPLTYQDYAELLQWMLAQQPRSVFMGLRFDGARSYDASLAAAQESIAKLVAASATPVYFAWNGLPGADAFPGAAVPTPRLASDVGERESYPLYFNDRSESGRLSAAAALYREACNPSANRPPLAGVTCEQLPADARPLLIRYGAGQISGHPYGSLVAQRLYRPLCAAPVASFWARLSEGLRLLKAGGQTDAGASMCVQTPWIDAYDLLTQADHETAPSTLRDKIVIFGYVSGDTLDYFNHPVAGPVAGAFYHAAALDNLLTYGAGYVTAQQPLLTAGWLHITTMDLVTLAVGFTFIFVTLSIATRYWREVARDARLRRGPYPGAVRAWIREKLVTSGVILVCASVMLVVIAVAYIVRPAPYDLLSLTAVLPSIGYAWAHQKQRIHREPQME